MDGKVLMVGLGGFGCDIAARVRERFLREDRNAGGDPVFRNIQFVGFDTDTVNPGAFSGLPMVHLARSMRVGELLEAHPQWKEWFPKNDRFLLARNGFHGTGQIRALGRLFLEDTLKRERSAGDPLSALHAALDHLGTQSGERVPSDISVLIVSSLCGGTGSGIFIQIALYLRKLFLELLGRGAFIRGLFVLPDMFFPTIDWDRQVIDTGRANAYAAIKELCAVNRLISDDPAETDNIRICYDGLLDTERDRDPDGRLSPEKLPYDSVYFLDCPNNNAMILRDREDYRSLAADIAYMLGCSPMGYSLRGREDGMIRIPSTVPEIFASAGCGKIVYPHDHIVEYCVLRMMADHLAECWLSFDREWRGRAEEARKQRKAGENVPFPDRGRFFTDTVEQCMTGRSAMAGVLRGDIMAEPQESAPRPDGKPAKKQELFMDALIGHLVSQLNGDHVMSTAARDAAQEIREDDFEIIGNAASEKIDRSEALVRRYYETVTEWMPSVCAKTISALLTESRIPGISGHPDFLRFLLTSSDGKAVHPVSARYLLYTLRELMKNAIVKAADNANGCRLETEQYLARDWDFKKEGCQTAAEAVPKLFFKRAYVENYLKERAKCCDRIARYAENRLISETLGAFLEQIDGLICLYESAFDSLGGLRDELEEKAKYLESQEGRDSGYNVYVRSSPQAMRASYDHFANSGSDACDCGLSDLYMNILDTLLLSVFHLEELRKHTADENQHAEENRLKQKMQERLRELFAKDASDVFRRIVLSDSSGEVNIGIVDAIEKECLNPAAGGQTGGKTPKSLLETARDLSTPWLLFDRFSTGAHSASYWGMGLKTMEELHSHLGLHACFRQDEVIADRCYCDRELCHFQAYTHLKVSDIPKFRDAGSDCPGAYYEAYASIMQRKRGLGDAISPHTDRRWDDPAALPPICTQNVNS